MSLLKAIKKKYYELHINFTKRGVTRNSLLKIKKNTNKNILSNSEKNLAKSYFKEYKKITTKYHNFYTEKTGKFYANYIPDNLYYCDIDMYYNDWNKATILDNKCLYNKLFPNVKQPKALLYRINNFWIDENMSIITSDDVEKIIKESKTELIIKEAYDSAGGKGVTFLHAGQNAIKEFYNAVKNISVDIVVQEKIIQHSELSKINKSSVNTIRILSFLDSTGNVKIYSSILRMGVNGSRVDNACSGGITCGINDDGTLKEVAYKANGDKYFEHPNSRIKFDTIRIPKFDEMKKLVKNTHKLIPMFRLVSWDLAVNENEEVILIEVNLKYGELDFHQLNNGPVFGDDTKKILDEVFKKKVRNKKVKKIKQPRLCLVSSSGGHWEQLQKLQPLIDKYDGFYVTEKTQFEANAKYFMKQTDLKDKLMPLKMLWNSFLAIIIWIKERPDFIITTGTIVAYPFYLLSILFHKKFVFIETFGRANMPTKAGKMMEKHSDLFIVQWESQKKHYKKAIYGGCLY